MKQLVVLFCLLIAYSIWTYGLTDPNLVLINWEPYWQFQLWMWQTLFHNRPLQTATYILLISLLFIIYASCIWALKKSHIALTTFRQAIIAFGVYCVVISPLFISYNALSHDVFNYMFNARMVLEYQANPHKQVALDFALDPWTRFMHNTHTTAPYWYGWTGLSLLPYSLGFGKFLLTLVNFRIFSLLSLLLLGVIYWLWQKERGQPLSVWQSAIFFLNPLVLIEIVSNDHNDLWMIIPAAYAFLLLLQKPRAKWVTLMSLVSLLFSASTKYATILLFPVWLVVVKLSSFVQSSSSQSHSVTAVFSHILKRFNSIVLKQVWSYLEIILPWILSFLLFIPLMTSRSRWFLPWYLTWSLSLLPLLAGSIWISDLPKLSNPLLTSIKKLATLWGKRWLFWLLALSVSSLYRYVPWILSGEYSPLITQYEIAITWLGGAFIFGFLCLIDQFRAKYTNR